jgi:hypothetical protein
LEVSSVCCLVEGSTLSQRKAKVEAARVKLEYANRQGELIKQKAKLEAQKLIENADDFSFVSGLASLVSSVDTFDL